MNELLDEARQLLEGNHSGRANAIRTAGWLTRAALEDTVHDLLAARGLEPGEASMRTQLCCLEVTYQTDDPNVPMQAEYAWAGLSRASHHHAFELTPSLAEVQHLWNLVDGLNRFASDRGQ